MAFLDFTEVKNTGKTKYWNITSKKDGATILGKIKWFSNWRRYCFFTEEFTIFDYNCLIEITEFINQEMQKRK